MIVMSICNCEFGCNDNLNVNAIEFLNVDVYVGLYVGMRVNVGVWIRM